MKCIVFTGTQFAKHTNSCFRNVCLAKAIHMPEPKSLGFEPRLGVGDFLKKSVGDNKFCCGNERP